MNRSKNVRSPSDIRPRAKLVSPPGVSLNHACTAMGIRSVIATWPDQAVMTSISRLLAEYRLRRHALNRACRFTGPMFQFTQNLPFRTLSVRFRTKHGFSVSH